MHNQVYACVSRLIGLIPDIDLSRVASCLGLDASKIIREADVDKIDFEAEAQRYERCSRLTIRCSHGHKTTINNLVVFGDKDGVPHAMREGIHNSNSMVRATLCCDVCNELFTVARLVLFYISQCQVNTALSNACQDSGVQVCCSFCPM